jgi:protein gp37
MAVRLKAMGANGYKNGFKLTLMPERLNQPLERKKPTKYFVNSMSDLFHEEVPFSYIDKIMDVIHRTPHHIYQILTKRAEVMESYFKDKDVPQNAWIGVSVEDKKYGVPRIENLRRVNASIRFLSVEPLIEDIGEINLKDIHWVIVGGESGRKAREMKPEWAMNVQKQCEKANVAFFFKQWGGWGADGKRRSKKENGRKLYGKTWDEMPRIDVNII